MSHPIFPATTKACRNLCRVFLAILFLCITAELAESAVVTLAWNPNSESDLAGYALSYGTTSGQLTTTIDVGNTTIYAFAIPDPTKVYYIAIRAYDTSGLFSPFSNEVATTPVVPPLTVTNMVANLPSPQPSGTTITFSATATGGTAPYQYKWWVANGTTSTIGRDWSTSNTFAWTPPTASPNYLITVWARNASSTIDNFDNPSAKLSLSFVIGSATAAATVSNVSPNSGAIGGGTSVTITGTNFASGATVTFGGTAATNVVVASGTSITARTPAHAAGAVSVTVTNPGTQGGTLTNGYTYVASAPVLTSLSPSLAVVGAPVTIAGTNFGATQGTSKVAFNGVPAVPSSWSGSSLVVPVPGGATSGPVIVTVGGVASNALTFTLNAPPTLALVANQTSAENSTVALQLVGSDPNGTAVSYSATALPAGLSLNTTTGVIGGKLTYSSAGTYTVTASVSDGTLSASRSFTWTVTNVNAPPVLTAPANQTSLRSTSVSLQLAATDPDSTALTYGATGLPPGLSVNSATGLISGKLSRRTRTYTVTATVSDGSLSSSRTFTWTVTAR